MCKKTEVSDDEVDAWDDFNGQSSDSTDEEEYEFEFIKLYETITL